MFGYVVPDKSQLAQEEFLLYNAFYCGLCKELGKRYGQFSRYTTNYDMTFFAVFAHDMLNQPVEFASKRCVGSPLRKKHIILSNNLFSSIADLNVLFSYYKLCDDINDGDKGKRLARSIFKKYYKKAVAARPTLDNIIRLGYERLAEYEKQGNISIDRVADCFSLLLKDCTKEILGKEIDENAFQMMYNIGKFVYLADALDDIDEDFKKKRYNPFLSAFKGYESRVQFINQNKDKLIFIFSTTVNRAIECFNSLQFNQSYPLLKNIVYFGLRKKVDELLLSTKKLKRPKI